WIEVYLTGYGWGPFEFTAGYSNQTIDTTPTTATTTTATESTETTTVESTEEHGTTTRRSRQTTTGFGRHTLSHSKTEATVTTVVEINEDIQVSSFGNLKYIVYAVIFIALTALLIYLRRAVILYLRKQHFTESSRKSRMGYMYEYTEKLLKYLKINRDDMQYTVFAEHVEESLGNIYFSPNEFRKFMNTALKSSFSEYSPENDELKKCLDFTTDFAKEIYMRSNSIEKIYLKIILVLI
ncbi:MAG: hypothetical protein K2J47_11785, partial [Ruminococcus sp.]|nr:hypothetical protein [Ruminococcus sp.]